VTRQNSLHRKFETIVRKRGWLQNGKGLGGEIIRIKYLTRPVPYPLKTIKLFKQNVLTHSPPSGSQIKTGVFMGCEVSDEPAELNLIPPLLRRWASGSETEELPYSILSYGTRSCCSSIEICLLGCDRDRRRRTKKKMRETTAVSASAPAPIPT